jgi:ribosomal-protein-serine acetyltransferase
MDAIHIDIGDGYVLRSLHADDVDALYAVSVADQEHLRVWMPWANDVQRAHTEKYVTSILGRVASEEALPALIVDGEQVVGSVGFNRILHEHGQAEIGYWLAKSHEGRGLMTAAVRALLRHGFEVLDLHRISIGAAPGNARSRAIPERLGFTEEGVLRESERFPDRFGDIVVYSILRHEWSP